MCRKRCPANVQRAGVSIGHSEIGTKPQQQAVQRVRGAVGVLGDGNGGARENPSIAVVAAVAQLQRTGFDRGYARMGVAAGESQRAGAGFVKTARATNYRSNFRIGIHVKAGDAGVGGQGKRAARELVAGGVKDKRHQTVGQRLRAGDRDHAHARCAEYRIGTGRPDRPTPVGGGCVPKKIPGAVIPCERGVLIDHKRLGNGGPLVARCVAGDRCDASAAPRSDCVNRHGPTFIDGS